MGAAVGKPAFGFAVAPRTHAEERLAVAEHALLQWTRSPGADAGIWDADASYTNRGLLAAVDDVLLLAAEDPFPPPARRRLDAAVAAAASRMVEELLRVRVWDASPLRAAVDRLSLASTGAASLLVFPSAATESSGGEADASDGTRSSRASSGVPDEVAALLDGEVWDELHLVRPAGVAVLHEIALRVTRAGCTKELFNAFPNAPCDVLDRFLSILRVECSERTTEAVIKRWTTVTKIIGKAIAAMRRQLHAQSPGAFDAFRDEYLTAIAENRILTLLDFADGFTTITSHEKLVYMLGMYEALSDAAPGLLLLFAGPRKELVAERTRGILTKLAGAVKVMVGAVMARVQGDGPGPHAPSAAVGVHPLARDAMACVVLLARHRTTLDLILAGAADGRGGPAGSLAGVVTELIAGLERSLQGCADAGGSRHLFLANNVGFILSRAADAAGGGAASLLGGAWAARRRGRLARHVASYVESCWGPAVAVLERPVCNAAFNAPPSSGGVQRVLAEFNAAFTRARESEARRQVPDPALRAALRNAVAETVLPAYCAFLQKHPKLGESVRYTADDLAESLSELFEGDAADARRM